MGEGSYRTSPRTSSQLTRSDRLVWSEFKNNDWKTQLIPYLGDQKLVDYLHVRNILAQYHTPKPNFTLYTNQVSYLYYKSINYN